MFAPIFARGAKVGRSLPLLSVFSNVAAARQRQEIDYAKLTGLPKSFAHEAAENALAGKTQIKSKDGYDIATFAAGCLWGVELEYQRVPGVIATTVGYVQGRVERPTYEEVSAARTGHTEAVQLIYDPGVVSYLDLCEIFWNRLGDSAVKYQQVGNDRGPQYRSGIYTTTPSQLKTAKESLVSRQSKLKKPIQTEVEQMRGVFWPAEEYHQQ